MVGGAEEMVDTLDYITVPATAAAAALQTQPFKWKFRKIWSLGWAGLSWAGLARLSWAGLVQTTDNKSAVVTRSGSLEHFQTRCTLDTGSYRGGCPQSVPQSTLTTPGTQQTRGLVVNTAHSEIGDLALSHSEQGAALR